MPNNLFINKFTFSENIQTEDGGGFLENTIVPLVSPLTIITGAVFKSTTLLMRELTIEAKSKCVQNIVTELSPSKRLDRENKLFLLENPEYRLTPKKATDLGKNLVFKAYGGNQLVVETQSDYLIDGVRLALKTNNLPHNLVSFIHRSMDREFYIKLNFVNLDNNYKFSNIPEGFCDQRIINLAQLAKS